MLHATLSGPGVEAAVCLVPAVGTEAPESGSSRRAYTCKCPPLRTLQLRTVVHRRALLFARGWWGYGEACLPTYTNPGEMMSSMLLEL